MISRIPFENPAMEIDGVRQILSCAAKPGGKLGDSIEERCFNSDSKRLCFFYLFLHTYTLKSTTLQGSVVS